MWLWKKNLPCPLPLQQHQIQTATALMNLTCWAVSLMSVISSKARLMAAYDFHFSLKVYFLLSEKTFVLHETVKHDKLVCSNKCFFSGHAYSVNTVEQFFISFLSPKSFPFSAID